MKRLTADDFFSGLFVALALRDIRTISLRDEQFDQTLERIFNQLQGAPESRDLDVRFRIRVHPIHGDSGTVRHAIADAAQRGVISLDNPEYQDIRIRLDRDAAKHILADLPGGIDLFSSLASSFVDAYRVAVS